MVSAGGGAGEGGGGGQSAGQVESCASEVVEGDGADDEGKKQGVVQNQKYKSPEGTSFGQGDKPLAQGLAVGKWLVKPNRLVFGGCMQCGHWCLCVNRSTVSLDAQTFP